MSSIVIEYAHSKAIPSLDYQSFWAWLRSQKSFVLKIKDFNSINEINQNDKCSLIEFFVQFQLFYMSFKLNNTETMTLEDVFSGYYSMMESLFTKHCFETRVYNPLESILLDSHTDIYDTIIKKSKGLKNCKIIIFLSVTSDAMDSQINDAFKNVGLEFKKVKYKDLYAVNDNLSIICKHDNIVDIENIATDFLNDQNCTSTMIIDSKLSADFKHFQNKMALLHPMNKTSLKTLNTEKLCTMSSKSTIKEKISKCLNTCVAINSHLLYDNNIYKALVEHINQTPFWKADKLYKRIDIKSDTANNTNSEYLEEDFFKASLLKLRGNFRDKVDISPKQGPYCFSLNDVSIEKTNVFEALNDGGTVFDNVK